MKKIIFVVFVIVLINFFSCKKFEKSEVNYKTPYTAFFETLETGKITDTILVQAQTQIFGCGTAAYEHMENLKKSGLDKFYERHKTVLNDTISISKFEKKHKTKILWVTRGYSGEKMELLDSVLHKNIKLEKRLWDTKNFIRFTETPTTMNSVSVFYSVIYPKEKKYYTKEYKVSKVNKNWESSKISTDKSEIKDFQYAYYPF